MMDFYLDGVAASSKGLHVEEITPPIKPARRLTLSVVSGRSGYLATGDDTHAQVTRYVTCFLPDPDKLGEIYTWLESGRTVRFSTDPAHSLDCIVYSAIEPDVFAQGVEITIPFACQPYRYQYPAAADIVLTAGGTVVNPGTAASEPRISVEATGDFILYVNGDAVEAGASVIIDSRLRDCLETDGVTLANNRVIMADFPVLSPGPNAISWTGAVTKVTITPRWRDM